LSRKEVNGNDGKEGLLSACNIKLETNMPPSPKGRGENNPVLETTSVYHLPKGVPTELSARGLETEGKPYEQRHSWTVGVSNGVRKNLEFILNFCETSYKDG
jgi:hypothetical protein